jgi:Ala-tRNA(Pro) deacylase
MSEKEKVYKVLEELEIPYKVTEHPAVYTAEEAEEYSHLLEGSRVKNLFLRDGKGRSHYLVIVDHDKMLDLKALESVIGKKRLGFASPRRLMKYLGLTPGSVSPFGLINDSEKKVKVFVDEVLKKEEKINFHPNDNTQTLTIKFSDLLKFLDWTGNSYVVTSI